MDSKGCEFCNMQYNPDGEFEDCREQHTCIVSGGWSGLYRAVDSANQLFLFGAGDGETKPYYPNFCPNCGRELRN